MNNIAMSGMTSPTVQFTPNPATSSSPQPQTTAAPATPQNAIALCASCDRCRARKTKCDGARPCGNCAAKYLKKNKLTSIDGIDMSEFECVYSPAKRRGPVPGRSGSKRSSEATQAAASNQDEMGSTQAELLQKHLEAQAAAAAAQQKMMSELNASSLQPGGGAANPAQPSGANPEEMNWMNPSQRQQLLLQQQLMSMQVAQAAALENQGLSAAAAMGNVQNLSMPGAGAYGYPPQGGAPGASESQPDGGMNYVPLQPNYMETANAPITNQQPAAQRTRVELTSTAKKNLSKTVTVHASLLNKNNSEGNRLRSYYDLSVNELFGLPPVPTDEEYCSRLSIPMKPDMLPRFDVAALQAARFAEIALGALANNQVALALELSNATVMCLRECVEEPVHPSCMLDVARAYFLHGIFRSFRGDMERYFKYRRVCLTHLSQLDNVEGVETLLAAMSFHDAWAYMIHNASSEGLPEIDDVIPPLPAVSDKTETDDTYGISSSASAIASHPNNQMWIQGTPPIFINNAAPPIARSLDALACAIRSCCDHANHKFNAMASGNDNQNNAADVTPTTSAVLAHQNELCSRNLVLSAFTLLQLHEGSPRNKIQKNHGHHLIISAMDAFLEGGDEEEPGGFTDSQIQSLLSVCNTVVEHPLILHLGGPTYHMVTNAAILLVHLLNGMYASRSEGDALGAGGEMEAALFEEVLDTFLSVRKLLNIHRRKMPMKLRCHAIPRPNNLSLHVKKEGQCDADSFIDLGETIMCGCRGCQGFVLMACSPCVAAERAQQAAMGPPGDLQMAREEDGEKDGDGPKGELYEMGAEFDLDDDALLNILSRIIST